MSVEEKRRHYRSELRTFLNLWARENGCLRMQRPHPRMDVFLSTLAANQLVETALALTELAWLVALPRSNAPPVHSRVKRASLWLCGSLKPAVQHGAQVCVPKTPLFRNPPGLGLHSSMGGVLPLKTGAQQFLQLPTYSCPSQGLI